MARLTKDQLIAQATTLGLSEGRDLASMTNADLQALIDTASQEVTGGDAPPVDVQTSTDAPETSSDAPDAEAGSPTVYPQPTPDPAAGPVVDPIVENTQPVVDAPAQTIDQVANDAFPPAVDPAIQAQIEVDAAAKEKAAKDLADTQEKLAQAQAQLAIAKQQIDNVFGKDREARLQILKDKIDAEIRGTYRFSKFDFLELQSMI